MSSPPQGWVVSKLSGIADFEMGQAPPASECNMDGNGTIFVKAGEFGPRYPAVREWTTKPLKFAYQGDVLVCVVGATAGKLNLGIDCAIGRSVAAIHPRLPELQSCIYNQLKLQVKTLRADSTGTAQGVISKQMLADISVFVPPLQEQKRISDKLDNVLTRVDAVNTRLARVAPILKRFRQSVLAAATSGRLTEDWRVVKGLQFDWRHVALGEVAKDFTYGSAAKSAKVGAVPVLRMGNIQNGKLDWEDLVFTNDVTEIAKYELVAGDVLFNRTNSPDLVGKTAVFGGERPAIYAGYLIRVRCGDLLLPAYLNFCLGSPAGREYCWAVKSDGVSQSNINAKKLAAFEFELPGVEEQTEIVRRVETLFTFADRLEARLQAAQTATERLTPALLAKAFRGELVPQDPNDEPASELLKRLAATATASAPKRGRRKAADAEA